MKKFSLETELLKFNEIQVQDKFLQSVNHLSQASFLAKELGQVKTAEILTTIIEKLSIQ